MIEHIILRFIKVFNQFNAALIIKVARLVKIKLFFYGLILLQFDNTN